MKIVIVCPSLRAATGNTSTVHRIQKYLNSSGVACLLQDMEAISEAGSGCVLKFMNEYVAENEISGVILLHAFKTAYAVLCNCTDIGTCCRLSFPFCIIFGGTDINIDLHHDSHRVIMQRAINSSNFAIAFTQDMKQSAEEISTSTPIFIQPQAVVLPNYGNHISHHCSTDRSTFDCPIKPILCLLVTSIRPVKDPMFILDEFLELHAVFKDLKLLIIGPILDEAYSTTFFKHLEYLQSKSEYLPTSAPSSIESPYDKIQSWMFCSKAFPILYSVPLPPDSYNELLSEHVFASINSSKSEGMSSAVLESMAMGIPVIAREIPGNCAVISESETGLLFDTPRKFHEQTKRLLLEPSLRTSITKNALNYVSVHHSPEKEKQFYIDMCLQYFQWMPI